MAARHVFTAAVLLLVVNCAWGKTNPFTPRCSMTERSYLFNECLMAFGWSHWNDRAAMQKATACLTDKLQCTAAATVVNCINNIPANKLNANCWDGLKDTLSFMLVDYNFQCSYYDIERKCWNKIPQLQSKSPRAIRQRAMGVRQQLPRRPPM